MRININTNKPTNTLSPVFKAKEYAIAKTLINGKMVPLNVYEINSVDTGFLDLMSSMINLRKLSAFKNYTLSQLAQWKNMINNSIMMVGFNEPQKSFLLTTNKNRPCGIITYNNFNDVCNLDYLVSWPHLKGQKIKYAGTTLMKVLFDDVLQGRTKTISLTTLSNSPVDLVKYYSKLGFKTVGAFNDFSTTKKSGVDMVILRNEFSEKSKELNKFIKIEKIDKPRVIDLKKILNINFESSL